MGLAATLVLAAPAGADDVTGQKAAVDNKLAALQAQIAASTSQEGVLTSQLSAVSSELEDAQSAVDEAEGTVESLEGELTAARARLDALDARLAAQARRLERLRAAYARAVQILDARVRAAYMDDPPDVVAFLVSASSFDELVDNVDFLQRLGAQDERIARLVAGARDRTAAARLRTADTRRLQEATVSVIAARTDEARTARDRLIADRDRLASTRVLKESALSGMRESREEYLREVNALAAQSAALAAQIRDAQAGSESTAGPSTAGLVWPVNGPVSSGFGTRWGRMHEGIDIAVAAGTPIHAAAGGTVIYASWMSGYGNLTVIDHGGGLATAYAHASAILVALGQHVSQGQTIALVGSTGHSTGPHLHFEVRVNGVAVDPLGYL